MAEQLLFWDRLSEQDKRLVLKHIDEDCEGTTRLEHSLKLVDEYLEYLVPFSVRGMKINDKLSLIIVPNYSGPATMDMNNPHYRKICGALQFNLIVPPGAKIRLCGITLEELRTRSEKAKHEADSTKQSDL